MGGEAVPQRVERYALVDLGHLSCCMASAIELAHREMVDPVLSGKQPSLRPCCPPPGAQQFEQMRRQHHVAVFVALALLHTDEHALAVDVADLERNHFGSPQARPIGHAQRRLVLEPGAALSSRATSSGLSTTGSLRGSRMNVVCSMISCRLSVTRKKNRSADTV